MFSKKEKILLGILAAIQFSSIVDFMIMMPLGPYLMRIFNITPHQFGLLVSSYTFFAGISGFTASLFVDKYDRKSCLLVFFTGFAIGTVACGLSPTYETLLLARGLTGVFGGVLSSLVLSIVSDAIAFNRRGSAMGVVMTSFSLASVLGVPIGLFLADKFNWHTPFLVLGGLACLLVPIIWKYIPKMAGHMEDAANRLHPVRVLLNIADNSNQRKALFFMFCVMFGHFSLIPFFSPSLVANVGLTESQLPLIYMVGGAFTIFTSPLIGRLADKFGKQKVFFAGALITIPPIIIVTNLGPSPLWVALTVVAVFFVFSGARMIPATALVSGTTLPRNRGSFMSIVSCVQQLTSAIASYVAGIIVTKGPDGRLEHYPLVGFIAIGFTLISLYISRRLKTVDVATHDPTEILAEPVI
ncbi:Purine efflux pump PbuE [compost metagenome]